MQLRNPDAERETEVITSDGNQQPSTNLVVSIPLLYLYSRDWGNPDRCPLATTLKDMGFNVSVGFQNVYFAPLGIDNGHDNNPATVQGEIGYVNNLLYLYGFESLIDETGNPEDCPTFIDIDISVNPIVLTSIYRSN